MCIKNNDKNEQTEKSKRRFLSPEKKFQIFLETQRGDKPVGEILRREGLYSDDLVRIREQVRKGATAQLASKPGRRKKAVPAEAYEALKRELEEKERALADLSVELTLLRKKRMGVRGYDSRHLNYRGTQTANS
jgi:transposase-like protein